MPICPSCGKQAPDSLDCVHCGASLKATLWCDACRRDVPAGRKACPYCGGPLGAAKRVEAAAPAAVEARAAKLKSDTVPCTGCGRPVAAGLAACQFCGAISPLVSKASPQAALAQGQALLAREAARSARPGRADAAWRLIDCLLFVLAAPLVVSSLLITAPFVKKWGRIPFLLVVLDAIVLLALSYSLGAHWGDKEPPMFVQLFFPCVVVASIAAGCLWVRRTIQGRREDGIFMGYSGLTLILLTLGSLLSLWGVGSVWVGGWVGAGAAGLGAAALGPGLTVYSIYRAMNE